MYKYYKKESLIKRIRLTEFTKLIIMKCQFTIN